MYKKRYPAKIYPKLSAEKQKEVLKLISDGKNNRQIKIIAKLESASQAEDLRVYSELEPRKETKASLRPNPKKPDTLQPKPEETIDNKKKEGGNDMALDPKELEKIVGTVTTKIQESLPGTIEEGIVKMSGRIATEIETLRKQTEDQKKKEANRLSRQTQIEENLSQIPELSKQVKTLEEQLKTLGGKPSNPDDGEKGESHNKGKGIFGTMHTNYEEFFNCAQCVSKLKDIVKKYGPQQVMSEMCADDEMCKVAVNQLSGRGFKIQSPVAEPTEDEKKKELAERAKAA